MGFGSSPSLCRGQTDWEYFLRGAEKENLDKSICFDSCGESRTQRVPRTLRHFPLHPPRVKKPEFWEVQHKELDFDNPCVSISTRDILSVKFPALLGYSPCQHCSLNIPWAAGWKKQGRKGNLWLI